MNLRKQGRNRIQGSFHILYFYLVLSFSTCTLYLFKAQCYFSITTQNYFLLAYIILFPSLYSFLLAFVSLKNIICPRLQNFSISACLEKDVFYITLMNVLPMYGSSFGKTHLTPSYLFCPYSSNLYLQFYFLSSE